MMARSAVVMIILLSVNLPPTAAFSTNDIEWAPAVSATLYKGGTLTNGDYMIKAVQFTAGVPGIADINGNIHPEDEIVPSVMLEVYKKGVLIKEIIMTMQSEPYIDPDYEVKISTVSFLSKDAKEWVLEYYNPWASMSIQVRGKPKLEVTVTTDKPTYTSYEDMIVTAKVTVKNSGDAFAKDVNVDLNPGELKPRGDDTRQLHAYYYRMNKGATQTFDVILVVPGLIDQKSYSLNATAKGTDAKDLENKGTGSVSITVAPRQNYFRITKAVRNRIYLQDTTTVRVAVANAGMYDIRNIHITDNMSDSFELKSSLPFPRDIPLLRSGESQEFTYSVRPLEANLNGFTIPAAAATFTVNSKSYSASSETPKVVVNGPKVLLNKTVSRSVVNISEDVIVTVSINNVGNIGTRIEVKDSLPPEVSLVSGSTSLSNWSDPNVLMGFSYTIRMMNKEGKVELPAAVANYTNVEYRGTVRAVKSSDRPVIAVIDPSKVTPTPTPTQAPNTAQAQATTAPPTPTPTPITPGFSAMLTVLVLVFAAARRRR